MTIKSNISNPRKMDLYFRVHILGILTITIKVRKVMMKEAMKLTVIILIMKMEALIKIMEIIMV